MDVALIEGVVSKKAGNKVFSVSQLLRHLNGNSRNGCTDEKIVEVTKRLRITHETYYSEPIGKLTCFQTNLLDIRGVRNEWESEAKKKKWLR